MFCFHPKYKKNKKKKWAKISFLKILGDKYKHFRRQLEYIRHFDFSGLATNFLH
jgi:transcription elongation factor GreA-like protein